MANVYMDYSGTTTGKKKDPIIMFSSIVVPESLLNKIGITTTVKEHSCAVPR